MEITQRDVERFEDKYTPIPESGCWLWDSSKDHRDYGAMCVGGIRIKAHRLSWLIHRGPIPTGLCVLHKCHTPGCVRPEHLCLGTAKDNARHRDESGRAADVRGTNNPFYGKQLDEQTRKKITDKLRGKPLSKEHRDKISKGLIGKAGYWKGKGLSKDHRAKIAAGMSTYRQTQRKQQQLEETK